MTVFMSWKFISVLPTEAKRCFCLPVDSIADLGDAPGSKEEEFPLTRKKPDLLYNKYWLMGLELYSH